MSCLTVRFVSHISGENTPEGREKSPTCPTSTQAQRGSQEARVKSQSHGEKLAGQSYGFSNFAEPRDATSDKQV